MKLSCPVAFKGYSFLGAGVGRRTGHFRGGGGHILGPENVGPSPPDQEKRPSMPLDFEVWLPGPVLVPQGPGREVSWEGGGSAIRIGGSMPVPNRIGWGGGPGSNFITNKPGVQAMN